MAEPRKVLISAPGSTGRLAWLPGIHGILKAWCELDPALAAAYRWLDPLHRFEPAPQALGRLGAERVDVLGLSCYCWNSPANHALARALKRRSPETLVVAGGPDLAWRDPAFFAEHPWVDVVVVQDGELAFSRILAALAAGSRDFGGIPGLVLPGTGGRTRVTGKAELPAELGPSPWLAARSCFEALASDPALRPGLRLAWETDRGCPYGCTFCDWGSSTLSKVRLASLERLSAEADWFGKAGIDTVFLTAANFGQLERDGAVLDLLIEARRRHGWPRQAVFCNAKSRPERVLELNVRAHRAGLGSAPVVAVEHADPGVLRAMARSNLPAGKVQGLLEGLEAAGAPAAIELIFGGPGDSLERWRRTVGRSLEWSASELITHPFLILPNAPAAEPAYREKWGLRSVRRRLREEEGSGEVELVVESSTSPAADYPRIYLFGKLATALHHGGPARLAAKHLRETHGVSYEDFYTGLAERCLARDPGLAGRVYRGALERIRAFAAGEPGSSETFSVRLARGRSQSLPLEGWLLFHFTRKDAFQDALAGHLRREYPGLLPQELVERQRSLLPGPGRGPGALEAWAESLMRGPRGWKLYRDGLERAAEPAARGGGA